MKTLLCLFACLVMTISLVAQPQHPREPEWYKMVDDFFSDYFRMNPTAGTYAGFHDYDTQLEDYSRAGVEAQKAVARVWLNRLSKYDFNPLSPEQRQDFRLVESSVKSTLLDLENIRRWEKNPDIYSSGITQSAFLLMARKFAAPEERLKSLIVREKLM